MPEIALTALEMAGEMGGEIAAGVGEAGMAAGEMAGSALGAGEGALGGIFSAAEPIAAMGTEAGGEVLGSLGGFGESLGSVGTDLGGMFGGGGVGPAGELGSFGGEAFGASAPNFQAVQDAIQSGALDAVGSNFTEFTQPVGGTDLSALMDAGSPAHAGGGGFGGTDLSGLMDAGSPAHAGGGFGSGMDVAGAAGGKAAEGAGQGMFGNIGSSMLGSLTKNPLGIAMAGAGLGYNLLKGSGTSQNEQNVQNIANNMAGQGHQLQEYLQNGTLPPGMQQQVDNAKAAAKAQIISGYASRGQSADPSMNSALAQELAAVDTNALELQGKIATNLLTAGINETNMSANLFQALIQMDQTQAKQMGQAIANFSTALAGGPKVFAIGTGATA